MAGKTLPGIGDDEESDGQSGERDSSGVSLSGANTEDPTPGRATDRMHHYSGPTIIDEDKVAEGLKRLRSLDEPLGAVSSMPTLKEGMPVVGAAPMSATPATPAASAQGIIESLRARGTAHGHAINGPNAPAEAMQPVLGDDRMKGTLLGHMLHLPDLPSAAPEDRAAEVRAVERPTTNTMNALTPAVDQDFSHGESRFFATEPERELEVERPRNKLMVRGAIAFAVVSIALVATIAWVRSSKPDTSAASGGPELGGSDSPTTNLPSTNIPSSAALGEDPNAQAPSAPPVAAEPAAAANPAPTEPAAKPVPPAPAIAAPPPRPAPEPFAAAPAPEATPSRTHAHSSRPVAPVAAPAPNSHARAASTTKPTLPGKGAPVEPKSKAEDPDGTLPLSD